MELGVRIRLFSPLSLLLSPLSLLSAADDPI